MKTQLLGFGLALSLLFNVFFIIGAWQSRQQAATEPADSVATAENPDPDLNAAEQSMQLDERRDEIERREAEIADRVAEKLELTGEQRDNFFELRVLIREEETLFRSSIEARRIAIDRELEEESPDEERILSLQQEIDDIEHKWRDAGRRYMESFLSTLTEDQRRAFFDMSRQKRRDDFRRKFDRNDDGVLDEAEEKAYRDAMERMRRGPRRGGSRGSWGDRDRDHGHEPPRDGPPPVVEEPPAGDDDSDVVESAWLPGFAT